MSSAACRFGSAALILLALSAPAAAAERCYSASRPTQTMQATLDVPEGDGAITGWLAADIANPAQNYFTSWGADVSGTRKGDILQVTLAIEIEGDRQREEQVWRMEGERIVTENDGTLEPGPCPEPGDFAAVDPGMIGMDGSGAMTAGHCAAQELAVLTCPLDTMDAVLSLCMADNRLRYVYGPIGEPTFVFPQSGAAPLDQFQLQTVGYSGGWDTQLQFQDGATTYRLFDQGVSRGAADPGKDLYAGVNLIENGQVVTTLSCDGGFLQTGQGGGGLGMLMGLVPEGRFIE